jgi:hypothetical protein
VAAIRSSLACRTPGSTRCRQQRLDRGTDPICYHEGTAGIELAVQVQERKTMDKRPDRGRQRVSVSVREASLDDLANVQRYRRGRGNALIVVPVARFSEHDPEQRGPLERELHVGQPPWPTAPGWRATGVLPPAARRARGSRPPQPLRRALRGWRNAGRERPATPRRGARPRAATARPRRPPRAAPSPRGYTPRADRRDDRWPWMRTSIPLMLTVFTPFAKGKHRSDVGAAPRPGHTWDARAVKRPRIHHL